MLRWPGGILLGDSPGGGFFLVVSTEISEGFLGSFISSEFHPSSPFDFQQKEGFPTKDGDPLAWWIAAHCFEH